MKKIVSIVAAALLAAAAGCSNNSAPKSSSLQPTPAVANVQPAPTPISETPSQPQVEQAAAIDTSTPAVEVAAVESPRVGGTYTVKHGDTLFHIATVSYGSGREWTKIAAANPGVDAKHLKVGQKLIIP